MIGLVVAIRDAEGNILLLVPEAPCVGRVVLQICDSVLLALYGLSSIDEILDRDAKSRSAFEEFFK